MPSTLCSFPTPLAEKQPQTITLHHHVSVVGPNHHTPPPCFSCGAKPSHLHHHVSVVGPNHHTSTTMFQLWGQTITPHHYVSVVGPNHHTPPPCFSCGAKPSHSTTMFSCGAKPSHSTTMFSCGAKHSGLNSSPFLRRIRTGLSLTRSNLLSSENTMLLQSKEA